jgi:hypothetical protein
MNERTCSTCKHFLEVGAENEGLCRANPPVPILLGVTQNALGQPVPVVRSFFPPTKTDVTCGAHRLNANALADIDLSRLATVETGGSA